MPARDRQRLRGAAHRPGRGAPAPAGGRRLMATGVTSARLVGRALELAQLEAALADARGRAARRSRSWSASRASARRGWSTELAARARGRRLARAARRLRAARRGRARLRAARERAAPARARRATPCSPGSAPRCWPSWPRSCPASRAAREQGVRPGEQARVFEALLAVLDGLSREQPLLLIIEDLHWADASTRAFLRFLAAALGREPLLVVATYRPDELHRRHPLRPLLADLERTRALRVDLGGLHARRSSREQLESILGTEPDAALVDRLYARSEGNPLFAEELLAAGVDGRGARAAEPGRRARAADRAAVARRAGARAGALGGRGARRRGARRGHRPGAARAARRACARRSRATSSSPEGDCYVLRHALLREAVHDDLLPGERAELHLALARALEAQDGPLDNQRAASIAHHYHAAGDQPAALAAAVRAGQSAIEVQAYREGAALFERALELWDRVPDAAGPRRHRRGRAARARLHLPLLRRGPRALGHAARARARARRRGRGAAPRGLAPRAPVTAPSGACCARRRRPEMLDRGLALLEADGPSPERAGLLARRAKSLMVQSRYHARGARGPPGARPSRRGSRSRAGATSTRSARSTRSASRSWRRAAIEEGAEALRRALDMAQRSHRALDITSTAVNLSDALHHVGRTPEALEVAREARAQLADLPIREAWLSLLISQQAFDAGDWDTVEEMLRAVGRRRPKGGTARARLHAAAGRARAGARRARGGAGGPGARGRAGRRLARAAVPRRARRAAGRARDARGRRRGRPRRGRRGARPDRVLLRRRAADGDGLGRRAGGRGRRRPARARPRRRRPRSRPRSPTPSC